MKSLVWHHSKRWWTITAITAVVIVLLVVYTVYSVTSWNAYQQRTQTWQSTTKQKLTAAMSLKATSGEQRTRKLTALKAITTTVRSEQTHTCTPARLTGWQLGIDGPRRAKETCAAYSKELGHVAEQLSRVTGYLEDELRVTDVLHPVLELPTTVNEANWQQTATLWGQVHANMTNLSVSPSFSRTKQQAVSVTSDLEVAWNGLIAAHGAKDKARFVVATAKLQEAYTGLAGISTINDSQLTLLTTRLQQLYSKL